MDTILFLLWTLGASAVTVASVITRTTPTPERPADDAPWLRHLWFQLYPLVEGIAFVGAMTKQQPHLAGQLAQAAVTARTSGDAAAVADIIEGAAAALGKRGRPTTD